MTTTSMAGHALVTGSADGLGIRTLDTGEGPGPTLLMTSPWPGRGDQFSRGPVGARQVWW
ncbi:hypothetical protein ABZW30_28255 [Kitasatospora sp. NPDC004669]|uniref:hypothetical protein n=1 Tax=Kitasatospora sp. NPDC004669 TaxID=3154555 RepID=UPI0033A35339